jgi:hypothetical protein
MSAIKYKFRTQSDLMFYILNAAGHDFIHDFNNYGRMGKILQYIMGLVENTVSSSTTATIKMEMKPVVEELYRQEQLAIEEKIIPPLSEASSVIEYDIAPTTEPAIVLDTSDVLITPIIPGNPPDQIKSVTPNQQTNATDNPIDNSTQSLSTAELYNTQIEENLMSEPVQLVNITDAESDIPVQSIVNKNIELYNYIAVTIPTSGSETRATTKKLNIMQRHKDFIQETKFLIISKLRSIKLHYGGKISKNQKGGNGVNIITRDDIVGSIKDIIAEINETQRQNLQLISYFEYIMYSYLYLSIPNISPLEIFNNSLIEDSACIFIIGQCNNTNIRVQSKLCLMALLSPSATTESSPKEELTSSSNRSLDKAKGSVELSKFMARGILPPSRKISNTFAGPSRQGILVGGAFNATTYATINPDVIQSFEQLISNLSGRQLFMSYYSTSTTSLPPPSDPSYTLAYSALCEKIYNDYNIFITSAPLVQQTTARGTINVSIIALISGPQMYSAKTSIIKNKKENAIRGGRGALKNYQEMIDTINDLIFIKTIDAYNDIKNRLQARTEDSGDGRSITGSAKSAVQKVSQLVAYKILELTGVSISPQAQPALSGNRDLDKQIKILYDVAVLDKGYTSADDVLIKHFIETYSGNGNILAGPNSLRQLASHIQGCSKKTCRVINNAVPSEVKSEITNIVVCPTSSVCDGMGSFGSCVNPSGNKEYANMNFSVSYGDETNSYYGQTNIKSDLTSVNINYGITYGNLQIYNFIDIKIDSQPIVLQANYVFKNLINRIIDLWKNSSATNIETLWMELYDTDYYLSILKLGSQKAIGDIFQEINSTLFNGGYNVPVQGVMEKNTYGLMGDRPSGVRVLKLLIDPLQGNNPKSSGGYVGSETTLIYFSQLLPLGKTEKTGKKGNIGGRITKKQRRKTKKQRRQTKKKGKYNRTKR